MDRSYAFSEAEAEVFLGVAHRRLSGAVQFEYWCYGKPEDLIYPGTMAEWCLLVVGSKGLCAMNIKMRDGD